ncbi:hypothetical protein [Gulosibacter chungangensis]|uniref:hypothetical protein n=1 Tax=Gulosibacter chungangensis TaxID=979746 RepID=UPI001CE46CC4|nr:hypothetical protein [Gulosibacter chungangensis]
MQHGDGVAARRQDGKFLALQHETAPLNAGSPANNGEAASKDASGPDENIAK